MSELLEEKVVDKTKKKKSLAITNAVFIGFLIGIIIYSAANNSLGFFTLIPLFLIFKLVNQSKNKHE